MHLLHQQSEEVLFNCFMTTLNAAFESKLTLQDEGYKSRRENFNIPTPLRHTSRILHVCSGDKISLDPITPHSMGTSQSHHKPVWCQLSFSNWWWRQHHTTIEPLGFCVADMLQAHLYHVWWPRRRQRRRIWTLEFSHKQNKYLIARQAFARFKPGFFQSEEMLIFINTYQ